jgi:chromosome partitioning protein
MRKIAVLNQKGGVGKTTTSVNLGAALARRGLKVCVADLDPQAHASLHLNASLQPSRLADASLYRVLADQAKLADIRQPAGQNLWVAAASIDLAAVEVELAGVPGREVILRKKLQEDTEPFDHLVIDCPPSLGILTLNALCAVDEVLIPLQPHFLALHGLSKLLETVDLVAQRVNPQLRVAGVLLCMYESSTRLAGEVARDISTFLEMSRGKNRPWSDATLFDVKIRRNVRLAEAPSFGQSIFDYAPDSPGAQDYNALADEFLGKSHHVPAPISREAFLKSMARLAEPVS